MSKDYSIAVIEKCADRLAFYNAFSGVFEDAISLPSYPHEMARDPDGRTAYVGHYGTFNSNDPAVGGSKVIVVDLLERKALSEPPRHGRGLQYAVTEEAPQGRCS